MGKFRNFFETNQNERNKELQSIWSDTFKALGLGGLSDEDAAQQSLSRINYGERGSKSSSFKGKQAVRKRLENDQIFSRLSKIPDPEIRKGIEQTRKWLDTDDQSNASTTVSNMLKMLFGEKNFEQFIDKDFPKFDPKAQVEKQPPKQSISEPTPDGSMTEPPEVSGQQGGPSLNGGPAGSQPQVQAGFMPAKAQNPLPPKPIGADKGLF